MDISIKQLLERVKKKLWIVAVFIAIGLAAGWLLGRADSVTYKADVSLISLNTERSLSLSYSATLEELNLSRRVANAFMEVAKSYKVAATSSKVLMDTHGIAIPEKEIRSMIFVNSQTDSSVMTITAVAERPELAIAVANVVSNSFVDEIKELTGSYYVSILDPAISTSVSIQRNKYTSTVIGFAGGFIIGLLTVYLLVFLDTRIYSIEDISVDANTKIMIVPDHSI